ncbi:TPA: hypothetical protein M4161_004479 [Klebsiella pneumoniae]|nr:hypothetical protein [Klebsiella pneumoniae]
MKPKTYLENVTFDFQETEECLGPHIALTFDFQGGAASGYNTPLLFKSAKQEEKEQVINKLKEIGIDVPGIQKEETKPVAKKSLLEVYQHINRVADEILKAQKTAPVKETSLTDRLIQIIKK